jgi:hypothetical protein
MHVPLPGSSVHNAPDGHVLLTGGHDNSVPWLKEWFYLGSGCVTKGTD